MYSNKGLKAAKEKFVPFKEYVNLVRSNGINNFYTADQNYIHTMLIVAHMNYVELDAGWNSFIHAYHVDAGRKEVKINDSRTATTKFVHIQLRGADHWDAATQERITNLPEDEWDIQ